MIYLKTREVIRLLSYVDQIKLEFFKFVNLNKLIDNKNKSYKEYLSAPFKEDLLSFREVNGNQNQTKKKIYSYYNFNNVILFIILGLILRDCKELWHETYILAIAFIFTEQFVHLKHDLMILDNFPIDYPPEIHIVDDSIDINESNESILISQQNFIQCQEFIRFIEWLELDGIWNLKYIFDVINMKLYLNYIFILYI